MSGPDEGKEIPLLGKDIFSLGRSDDNDVVLDDTSVSRHHAQLILKDGVWYAKDLGARNGTFVNDKMADPGVEEKLALSSRLRLGVYELQFLEKEFAAAEENKPQPAPTTAVDKGAEEFASKTNLDDLNKEVQLATESPTPAPKMGRGFQIFGIIALSFCLIGVLAYFVYDKYQKKTDDVVVPSRQITEEVAETVVEQKTETVVETPVTDSNIIAVTEDKAVGNTATESSASQEYSLFLDIRTEPLPATIYFQDERIGVAPLKQSITIKPNQGYVLYADFELRELNDVYRKKVEFKPRPDVDVVEVAINAEIGVLKILKLPAKVDFYLEGYYEHDTLKANPVKITDIVYGKPIYLPYGKYMIELRERTKIAGSETEITQIRYQREYDVSKDNNVLEMNVTDRDLQLFPAIINSVPSHAEVYYGADKVGNTPYTGLLALGPNKIKVVKDGFFAETIDINMTMNSVYQTTVTLKTSKIGELINEAKEKLRHEQNDDAIHLLIDALKYGGSQKEKAEVYFILGDTYLKKKDHEKAKSYFEKAQNNKKFTDRAALGLVKAYHGLGNTNQALTSIVGVLAKMDDKTPSSIRTEANEVFKKISPIKSVIYIHSEPAGADVFVNDKKINQATPLILSDLGLGNYRIQIEKAGFEKFNTKQNLKMSEFVVIKVKLNPEPL